MSHFYILSKLLLKNKMLNNTYKIFTPRGIRIPVSSVKGRCPRPLDDGGFKD